MNKTQKVKSNNQKIRKETNEEIVRRTGGYLVAHLTALQQSRVRIRVLPSPQQTLVSPQLACHLGW